MMTGTSDDELAQFLADADNLDAFIATARVLSLGFEWTGEGFVNKSTHINSQ